MNNAPIILHSTGIVGIEASVLPEAQNTTVRQGNDVRRVEQEKKFARGDVLVVLRRRHPSHYSDEWEIYGNPNRYMYMYRRRRSQMINDARH